MLMWLNGLCVIDIDFWNGGNDILEILVEINGFIFYMVIVRIGGGGKYYFFRYEGESFFGSFGVGVDLKWNGYIIVLLFFYLLGVFYRWENDFYFGIYSFYVVLFWIFNNLVLVLNYDKLYDGEDWEVVCCELGLWYEILLKKIV